jgi:hypothetical protein
MFSTHTKNLGNTKNNNKTTLLDKMVLTYLAGAVYVKPLYPKLLVCLVCFGIS